MTEKHAGMNSNNCFFDIKWINPYLLSAVTTLLQSVLYPGILILLYTLQIKGISPPCPTQALSACQPTASPVCVSECECAHATTHMLICVSAKCVRLTSVQCF